MSESEKLLRAMDAIQREHDENTPELETMCEKGDDLWNELTPEERARLNELSIQLYDEWTPSQRYREACRIIRDHPATRPEYWTARRDQALKEMSDDDRRDCLRNPA